jgi:hypothetical protein
VGYLKGLFLKFVKDYCAPETTYRRTHTLSVITDKRYCTRCAKLIWLGEKKRTPRGSPFDDSGFLKVIFEEPLWWLKLKEG